MATIGGVRKEPTVCELAAIEKRRKRTGALGEERVFLVVLVLALVVVVVVVVVVIVMVVVMMSFVVIESHQVFCPCDVVIQTLVQQSVPTIKTAPIYLTIMPTKKCWKQY